jgi:putative PIN family toxin of toxin-antitoxin system
MKILFDTNVLVAAFISHGVCNEVFDHCLDEHDVYTSDYILNELINKLVRKFQFPEHKIQWALKNIVDSAVVIKKATLPSKQISRDKDDDNIIAAALKANVDCIISGDKDLLVLKTIKEIPILKPNYFWKFEKNFKSKNS